MKKTTLLGCVVAFCCIHTTISQTNLSDSNIHQAASMWVTDRALAVETYGEIANWDVSSVTDMSSLFSYAESFNDDISAWDVSNVTNMRFMFLNASEFNRDISAWNVANVVDMSHMFSEAKKFNQSLDGWDVSSVTNMNHMFSKAEMFNQNLNSWDVSKVTDMAYMFYKAKAFNGAISNWNTGNVTSMSWMFSLTFDFNQDIGTWNMSRVTNLLGFLREATSFNQDISNWNVSRVTNMNAMLYNATSFSDENYTLFLDGISQLQLQSNVTLQTSSAYCNATARTSLITNYGWTIKDNGMARGCETSSGLVALTDRNIHQAVNEWVTDKRLAAEKYGNIEDWDVSNVTNMSQLFKYKFSFNEDISKWDVSNVINMSSMFSFADAFRGDISSWNVANVEDMKFMFSYSSFSQNISTWNTAKVKDMSFMFYKAYDFNSDISNWNTSNVIYMNNMFSYSPFNKDLSKWDVSKVISMKEMFYRSYNFNQDISDWDVANVNDMTEILTSTSSFSQENYDLFLEAWSQLSLQSNVQLAVNSKYCAITARQNIIDNFGWNIQDSGLSVSCFLSTPRAAITDSNIHAAVNLWMSDKTAAESTFGPITDWDVSNVTHMNGLFKNKTQFNEDISNWDVSNVTNMSEMFADASNFNVDISNWDVSNVYTMMSMFENATSFNSDISTWDVSNVFSMLGMLEGAYSFSVENYTEFLESIAELNLRQNVVLNASTQICDSDLKQRLVDEFGWDITDFGSDGSCGRTLSDEIDVEVEFSVYPVPTTAILSVEIPNDATFTINTTLGSTVMSGFLKLGYNQLNIDQLPEGVYFLQLKTNKGMLLKRIIKE
ncbi:MAG: BspA family leucine-rich repeat surface protein [Flavicella sp.]